jgi:hypothetical protein
VGPCDPPTTPPSNPPSNPPGNPPSNPPGNPPSGGTDPGSGGGGTKSGNPPLLPDTAIDPPVESLALVAGMLMVGGSASLAMVAVRRGRSDRR